jgi:hypothetical protein
MECHHIKSHQGHAVSVVLQPIECRRLLDLSRFSLTETERRLFWRLISFDNGAPKRPIVFTSSEINLLVGLASYEATCAPIQELIAQLCDALSLPEEASL